MQDVLVEAEQTRFVLLRCPGVAASVRAPRVCPQPSERLRVEILSLSLLPEGRVARDHSVARLFVEYSLLDLPTEETPLSLPKPPQGKNINYNYSKGEAARPSLPPCVHPGVSAGRRILLWAGQPQSLVVFNSCSCGR